MNVSINSRKEFTFTLSRRRVAHGSVTFTITNKGNLPHDFELCASQHRRHRDARARARSRR